MHYPKLTIRKKQEGDKATKGRSFSAHLVAMLSAAGMIPSGSSSATRPLLLAYAGTPSAVRAVTANLRAGEIAATDNRRFELLRSLGYRYHHSAPVQGSSLVVAYLPDLLHLRPGGQPSGAIRFVHAPPRWWLDEQERLLAPDLGADARHHAWAMSFVARLDARCPWPIANSPDFQAALAERALEEPWVQSLTRSRPAFEGFGCEELGLEAPVFCDVGQAAFAEFLAGSTAELLPRFVSTSLRRTLPNHSQVSQLSLAFQIA